MPCSGGRGSAERVARNRWSFDHAMVRPLSRPYASLARFRAGGWYAQERSRITGETEGSLTLDHVQRVLFDDSLSSASAGVRLAGALTATFTGIRGEAGKMSAPFSPRPVHDALGNCVVYAAGDGYDLRVLRRDGTPVAWIRNPWPTQRVSPEMRDAWVEARLAVVPEQARPSMRRVLARVPAPEHLPAYRDLVVDALGYVWGQTYTPPDGPGRAWIVFRPDGSVLGSLEMPRALEILDVGENAVVGLWTADSGEEVVGVYELRRGDEPPADGLCGAGRGTSRGRSRE